MTDKDYAEILKGLAVPIHAEAAMDRAIDLLERGEDEYIKVPKKAMKYVTKGMVAYNYEWLREHFDIERLVVCGDQEPCEDAISRQSAIDGLNSINGTPELDKAFEVIENLPPVNPQPKTGHWIPVSERLPEDGERVLATHLGCLNPKRQVIEHIYENGKFTRGWDMDLNMNSSTFGQRYMGRVIAWMPLPEPYKAESEET